MDLGIRIGVDRYYDYLRRFGIGQKTGVDSFAEPSGLVLPQRYVRPVDLARIAFGQAIAVSPVQFQNVLGALLGDGILRTPRIANRSEDEHGNIVRSYMQNNRGRRIVSESTSAFLRELMGNVVINGSGKHAGYDGYYIGGKTGTAQKYKDGIIDQGKYISSFIGYMSVNGRPKYSVYLMVDEPSAMGYYGSIVAAPYVGQIFRGIAEYLKIPPSPEFTSPNKAERLVEVPMIAGLQVFQAVGLLSSMGFHIDVSGDGSVAVGSFPVAGSRVRVGEPVVVRTG
jgi:stage V sporulation protein D (sporulation-specific penicillin-binding protein)